MKKGTDQRNEVPSRLAIMGPEMTQTFRETRRSSPSSVQATDTILPGPGTSTSRLWCNDQAIFIQIQTQWKAIVRYRALLTECYLGAMRRVVKNSNFDHEPTTL